MTAGKPGHRPEALPQSFDRWHRHPITGTPLVTTAHRSATQDFRRTIGGHLDGAPGPQAIGGTDPPDIDGTGDTGGRDSTGEGGGREKPVRVSR